MISKKKWIGLFEIVIMVLGTIAFAYFAAETNPYFNNGIDSESSKLTVGIRDFIFEWWNRSKINLASAQEGLWTCLEDLNGTICQEYPSDTCNENCATDGGCFQGARDDYAECRLGTCFDSSTGECQPSTPKAACENVGGEWSEDSPPQCAVECCLINPHGDGFSDQTQYITEQSCNYISDVQGVDVDWVPVENEIECLLRAGAQEEGACVLEEIVGEGFNCKFTSKSDCLNSGGDFNKNLLCSNEGLNTICEKQESVGCFDGEDGVYWFDSCGNKENIYDSDKVESWNNGAVLALEDSCVLGDPNDPVKNQNRCGNCDYLLGSVCGAWTSGNKHIVNDELGDFVCRDLSCTDEWGDDRKNGESWCSFDSQVGLDNENQANEERSVDVPGSGHYRRVCLDGEVRTETCSEFRSEVCVESRDESIDFSSAACRINQWQICLEANTDETKLDGCEENTDCSLHGIDLDDFEFDVCTPKYPPGFDLSAPQGGEVGESVCSVASQTCTMIEVKKLFGGWDCEVNCDCEDPEFTEAMNNLCISLGDCGGHVNIAGRYTDDGYSVEKAPRLDSGYISGLENYAGLEKGQFVEQLTGKELAALFGVSESTFENDAKFAEFIGKLGAGATGGILVYGAIKLGGAGVLFAALKSGGGLVSQQWFPPLLPGETASMPVLQGTANAAAGLAAGAAIGFLVAKVFGFQGEAVTILVIIGALSGLGASLGLFGPDATILFSGAWLITVIIIIAIIAIILYFLGIGKTRKVEVDFTCSPWQPPSGGQDCSECGDDPARPCTRYKCQSLGQTCEIINEGSDEELCIDVNPNDSSAPIISPNEEAIDEDHKYVDEQNNGVKIEAIQASDGCIKEYSPVEFGVSLNEPGQCKIEETSTSSYRDMSNFFGGSNLYKIDHEDVFAMPTLSSLGVSGIDPGRRGNYDLYVRCQDASGNANVQEYVIELCVAPADDITAPAITEFIPDPGYVGFNVTEKFVQFYTNEPADCKWSLEDKVYESMENTAICNNEINDVTLDGWLCSTTLPVPDGGDNIDYYFRCADQPWLEDNDDGTINDNRNTNNQGIVYTLIKTVEELVISSIIPNNVTIINGTGDGFVSVDLLLQTEGGVDGSALCEFSFNGDIFSDFFETGGITHKQTFSTLLEGAYDISLMCTDVAKNVATENATFDIELDGEGPTITRVYEQGNSLTVITDEDSTCAYDFNSCGFNFDEGELMSGNELMHTTEFEAGLTYHIKCKDLFGNVGACLQVAEGY